MLMHTGVYLYMYTRIDVYVYMHICTYVYMYLCIDVYMYICIYLYMYICICVYMYICIYVHMYMVVQPYSREHIFSVVHCCCCATIEVLIFVPTSATVCMMGTRYLRNHGRLGNPLYGTYLGQSAEDDGHINDSTCLNVRWLLWPFGGSCGRLNNL